MFSHINHWLHRLDHLPYNLALTAGFGCALAVAGLVWYGMTYLIPVLLLATIATALAWSAKPVARQSAAAIAIGDAAADLSLIDI